MRRRERNRVNVVQLVIHDHGQKKIALTVRAIVEISGKSTQTLHRAISLLKTPDWWKAFLYCGVIRRYEHLRVASAFTHQAMQALQWQGEWCGGVKGDYRVIYTFHDEELVVLVVRVGHRKEVYRGVFGPSLLTASIPFSLCCFPAGWPLQTFSLSRGRFLCKAV